MSYSGAPAFSNIVTFDLHIPGEPRTTIALTIDGETHEWTIVGLKWDPLGEFELDTPKHGTNRGVPRLNPTATMSGSGMPRRLGEILRATLKARQLAAPIDVTIMDEAAMTWTGVLVAGEVSLPDGLNLCDYKLTFLLQQIPSTVRTVCS